MMMGREELAEAFLDESSQCSSGCQSGWTLYLEHSGTSGQQQCCSLPYQSDVQGQVLLQSAESDEEDSMVSDASSGPLPHLPEEEEELQVLQGQSMLRQQRRRVSGDHCYYSGSGGRRSSANGSGSRSFGSTRSSSMGEVKSRKKRKAVVQREEAAIRRHGIDDDDDDDLHDTASSSAVAPLDDAVEAMHCGGDVTELPSCALSATHNSPEWAPAVRRSTAMQQGYAMLHHN